jgi:exodeoxyribonuclease VII small subunit
MASTKRPAAREPSFEERMGALEAVVRDLEGEGLTLEQSLARYREGVEHLKACRTLLDDAEARLLELVGADDEAEARPLRVTEKGLEPIEEADDGEGSEAGSEEE